MKKNLKSLALLLAAALTLIFGYGLAQRTQSAQAQPAQTAQTQTGDNDVREDEAQGQAEEDEAYENEAEENEAEEMAEMSAGPAQPLTDYGSVTLEQAVASAQSELGVSAQPFEATLEKLNGQLVWMMDFVEPAKQVVIDATGAGLVTIADLSAVPSADAVLTDYGKVSLADAVDIAKQAYGSPADVTEVALEKDGSLGDVLTWRIDVADKLVVINAEDGSVIGITPL